MQEHAFFFSSLSEAGVLHMRMHLLHSDIIDFFLGQGRKYGYFDY